MVLSQGELVRVRELGLPAQALDDFRTDGAVSALIATGWTPARRKRLAAFVREGRLGNAGLDDDTLEMIREQFRRFTDEVVRPQAQGWHERNELIPLDIVAQLAELGVFGLTVD